MVLELIRFVKRVDPQKLVIAGGVNARNLRKRFFDAGVDVIVLSEAERTIVEIAEAVRGKRNLTDVPGIAFRDETGRETVNRPGPMTVDLDELPFPAWDLLPLEKYWDLSRPHGGQFPEGERITYQIVGGDELDEALGKNRISYEAPLGRALLGKREGDSVQVRRPAGDVELTIVRVEWR